jgi:predicted benzoate:H+ symporter BenE
MTASQLILVSVTSALIAVFAMLLVATLKRSRREDDEEEK